MISNSEFIKRAPSSLTTVVHLHTKQKNISDPILAKLPQMNMTADLKKTSRTLRAHLDGTTLSHATFVALASLGRSLY